MRSIKTLNFIVKAVSQLVLWTLYTMLLGCGSQTYQYPSYNGKPMPAIYDPNASNTPYLLNSVSVSNNTLVSYSVGMTSPPPILISDLSDFRNVHLNSLV